MSDQAESAPRGIEIQVEPGLALTVVADQPGEVKIYVKRIQPCRETAEPEGFVNDPRATSSSLPAYAGPPVRRRKPGRVTPDPIRLTDPEP